MARVTIKHINEIGSGWNRYEVELVCGHKYMKRKLPKGLRLNSCVSCDIAVVEGEEDVRGYTEYSETDTKRLGVTISPNDDRGKYIFESLQTVAQARDWPVSRVVREALSSYADNRFGRESNMILRRVRAREVDNAA